MLDGGQLQRQLDVSARVAEDAVAALERAQRAGDPRALNRARVRPAQVIERRKHLLAERRQRALWAPS